MPLDQCNSTVLEHNKKTYFDEFQEGVYDGQYCAHDPKQQKDSCKGDSGGPLQLYPPNSYVAKIVGIISFGIGCGTEWPGIYTRVAFYQDWIESHVWPKNIKIQ